MISMLQWAAIARAAVAGLGALVWACPATADAGTPPDAAPVEIIVPFGTGGGADALARTSATLLADRLAAPIQVVNVPGLTGLRSLARLLSAPADGRTLAVLTADTFSLLAFANPGWRLADVTPLAVMIKQPSALFLPTNSRLRDWAEFEREARQRPDTLRVAITGRGSPDYLALQQLEAKGIRLVPVPLSNPEERYRAVLEGAADALYEQPGDVAHLTATQQLRPVLVFAAARLAGLPNVPTSQERGLGHGFAQFRALVVRSGTDPARVAALSDSLAAVADQPAFQRFLKEQGADPDSFISARHTPAFMQVTLGELKAVVNALPLHASHLYFDPVTEAYIEPF